MSVPIFFVSGFMITTDEESLFNAVGHRRGMHVDAAARKWNRVRQCLKWGQVGRPITPKSLSYEYIFIYSTLSMLHFELAVHFPTRIVVLKL